MALSTAPLSLTPVFRQIALARNGGGLTDGQLLGEFVRAGDPVAFEALLRRHGPMVLGVCRRVVRDTHLADDAFQAVWLVLARRAAAVRPRDHVGNWLYGVAVHTALKARRTAHRWKTREKQVSSMPHPAAPPAAVWSDLAPIVDEELARLPDPLRLAVVLCDLEGRPQRDAARQLGVPVTTLVTRLAKARRTLAARLSGRGVALSGGALSGVLTANASPAAVPPALATAAVAAATAVSAGAPAAVPAAVQFLSEGVMRMILVSKLKATSASAVALAGLALGLAAATIPAAHGQSAPADPAAKQPLNTARSLDDVAFLRRACVDLRGSPPTDLEQALFRTDTDPKKRTKVVEWLMSDEPPKTSPLTTTATNLYGEYVNGMTTNALTGTLSTTLGQPTLTNLNASPTLLATTFNDSSFQPLGTLTTLNDPAGQSALLNRVNLYENAYIAQTRAGVEQERLKQADAEREKLKAEIAALKAKITAAEKALQAGKAEAEKTRQEQSAKEAMSAAVQDLNAKLAALEKQKPAEKKPEPTETRKSATEALLKLTAAQEKVQAEKLVKDKLAKAQAEKLVQDKLQKTQADKLLQDKQRAAYEKSALESRRVLREKVESTGDAAFLQRVIKTAYGVSATALELKYFAEDKDPKKREKLVDLILADPAAAKKLGPNAKAQLLAEPQAKPKTVVEYVPTTRTVPYSMAEGTKARLETAYVARTRTADPLAKLLDQVLDGKRSNEQVADAVTLATVGRYPTESEQKMMLSSVAGAADRKAAWKKVLDALAGTKEAQAHADSLKKK